MSISEKIRIRHGFLPTWERYLIMSIMPIYFMLIGLTQQSPKEIFDGILRIIQEPDLLITDYFVVGGVGASFLNAGILTLICLLILYFTKSTFDGFCIASMSLMFGFSLFGKNLFNIWSILIGYALYAKIHRIPIKQYIHLGFYGTSLSPIITHIIRIGGLSSFWQFVLASVTGLVIGYVLVPISLNTKHAHKGYSLYNVGFSCGIIATVIVSLLKSFGVTMETRVIWDKTHNEFSLTVLTILYLALIVPSLVFGKKEAIQKYILLLRETGVGGVDFLTKYGDWPTLLNIGINGLFATWFVYAIGADLNGPSIGSLFCIIGFSATGKHIRNIAPIMLGVYLADFLKIWTISDPGPTLALILSTTLAPIPGEFGVLWGILAGFIHSSVALNVGVLYHGSNLYNNGFAGGIVAIFLVPVIQSINSRKKPSESFK